MRHRKLLIAAAAFVALWTVGWFALRHAADAEFDRALADLAGRGVVVLCPGRELIGFPVSFDATCGALVLHDGRSGLRVAAGPTMVGAGLAHPTSVVAELGSPFTVRRSTDAATIRLDWEEARFVGGIGLRGARSGRFRITNGEGRIADRRLAFAGFSASLEPASGGSDVEVRTADLSLIGADGASEPMDIDFSTELSVPPSRLAGGRAIPAGFSAERIRLRAQSASIVLTGDGRLALGPGGLPSGVMTIRLVGIGALPAYIASLPSDLQPIANSAAGALMAFGRAVRIDGTEAREIEVSIDRGLVTVGAVPLGRIGGL